jgi:hypothetical protein
MKKLLTGLTCVLKESYNYAQKLNLEVKQILFKLYLTGIMKIELK